MPANTAAKRYSAMNLASPWRGLNVVPNVAKPQGELQAVMFLYSGILATAPTTPTNAGFLLLLGAGACFVLMLL